MFGDRAKHKDFVGNIYKGKVAKVLPGMQAAFVDIGLEKAAFMHVSDLSEEAEPGDTLNLSTAEIASFAALKGAGQIGFTDGSLSASASMATTKPSTRRLK